MVANFDPLEGSLAAGDIGIATHLEITVDWGVSDTDGDLSIVRISAEDADGNAFSETHEHTVSGSSASGTDEFQFKRADGEMADVTIYVEDAAGNSNSHTEQITE
jgi:subtilisin